MSSKSYLWLLATAMLLVLTGQVLARRVNHDVTPANIAKLPFSATVQVRDAGKLKVYEITIKGIKANLVRPLSPGGWLELPSEDKPGAAPGVTKVEKDGTITFTFQLSPGQVERARFDFVEDLEDWNRPFPTKGDCYQFLLKEFKGKSRK